jgi:hypothetical protein
MAMGTYLTTREVAEALKLQPQSVRLWRSKGTGPAYLKINHSRVLYDQVVLAEWIKARVFTSTADETVRGNKARP